MNNADERIRKHEECLRTTTDLPEHECKALAKAITKRVDEIIAKRLAKIDDPFGLNELD